MEKYTLITGASSGLGKEFAKLYAKDNNNLILVGTNLNRLNETKEEVLKENQNVLVEIIAKDLSSIDNCKEVFRLTEEKGCFVNNLVNAAGFGDCTDFKDMDIDLQIKLNHVNVDALLYFTRVYLTNMLANDEGHIINISSIAAFFPGPYMTTYHASKAYVLNLGEAIAEEIKKTNVKILTLCPGPFDSGFVSKAHNDYTFKKIKPISAREVAEYGYKMSLKGKRVKIVGFKNKITCFLPRFVSRKFVSYMSANNIKDPKKQ